MPDVGVRELKQRLSEYLDRAERGEVLRVTDRGRPKAVLGPLPGRARIDEGVAGGWIAAGSGEGLRDAPRWTANRRVLDVLSEDRGP
ncbi:MAG TPA: type II toxin-antitoxin system prevent-host-death family antitoxin [Solirubrobacteraceae bacterium]|nr:type II toxin-antitoxin system prevent-host-death family antitoxin [Solirubrobacteraceae bacterium]